MSLKQTTQEIESDTESSVSFEVSGHVSRLQKSDSKKSIGEIFL